MMKRKKIITDDIDKERSVDVIITRLKKKNRNRLKNQNIYKQ